MESNSKVLNLLQAARLLMSTEFGVTNSPQTAIRIVQELDCSRDIGMILIDAGVKSDSNEEGLDLFTLKGYQKEDMKYRGREASIYRYGFNYALSVVASHIRTSRKDSIDSMKLLSFFKELQDSVLENDIEESVKAEEKTNLDLDAKLGNVIKPGEGRALSIFNAVLAMYKGHHDLSNEEYSFHYLVVLASELEDGKSGDDALYEASKFVQEIKGRPKDKAEQLKKASECTNVGETEKLLKNHAFDLVEPNSNYQGMEALAYRKGLIDAISTLAYCFGVSSEDSVNPSKINHVLAELTEALNKDFQHAPIGEDGTTTLKEVQTQEGIKVGVGSTKQTKGRALRIFEAAMFMERELSSAEKTGYSLEYFLGLATALEDNFTAEESLNEASKTIHQLIDKAKKSEEMTEVETE